jgi:hypothetical protein
LSSSNGAGLALRAALASTSAARVVREAEAVTEGAEFERDDQRAGGAPASGEQPEGGGAESAHDQATDRKEQHGNQRPTEREGRADPAADGGNHEP